MKFLIEQPVLERFSPIIGVIIIRALDNKGSEQTSHEIQTLMRTEEERLKNTFAGEGSLATHSLIAAWRKAYKAFGADSYRCSAEALARRVLKGDRIPSINTLVDLYNLVSLRYVLPIGGEDLDAIQDNLALGFCKGNEPFVRIGGSENEPPVPGEVAYKDTAGVVCRRFNWREADRTKLTEHTRDAIIMVDGLVEIGREAVIRVRDDLAALIEKYCGGELARNVVDRDHPEMALE